jgi:hypothetical protein
MSFKNNYFKSKPNFHPHDNLHSQCRKRREEVHYVMLGFSSLLQPLRSLMARVARTPP